MPDSTDDVRAPRATASDIALQEAKRALRTRVLAQRDALEPEARRRDSEAIVERVWSQPEIRSASTLLVTFPFGSEWDTRPLVQRAFAAGQVVVVPRVDVGARMLVLHMIREPSTDIVPGHRGIPEPRHACAVVLPSAVDAVLVPGIAFDARCGRLGYGGGFYDRLLPLTRDGVPRIAGAFDAQLVDRVPRAAHDLAVDCVITPTRLFRH